MPKIIKNLDSKILETVFTLMEDYAYDDIDMRMVAKKCNIAVGTLYNYFSSKKVLFSSAVVHSWQTTQSALDDIINSQVPAKTKLQRYITELSYGFDKRKGVGRRLFFEGVWDQISKEHIEDLEKNNRTRAVEMIQAKNRMIADLISLLKISNQNEDFHDYERLASLVFLSSTSFVSEFPKEKEHNNDFIIMMVNNNLKIH